MGQQKDTAKRAGLRHLPDDGPGFARRRRGSGWSYHRPDGTRIVDPRDRARIDALAIPPAWTDVWIAPDPRGHLQASGRDARGRKQYRYHARWDEARDAKKRDRVLAFGQSLRHLRREVRRAIRAPGLGEAKVAAAVVTLLETAAVRVGNDEYTQTNGTFGLSTLRTRHVKVSGPSIELRFVAKGGREESVVVEEPSAARVVKECLAVPGREVFKWFDSGGRKRDLKSHHVNDFIRAASGGDFTAKDVRTWVGTLRAYRFLLDQDPSSPDADLDSHCLAAVDAVADFLRDTREVARSSYIHQGVLDAYRDGTLHERRAQIRTVKRSLLSADERALVHLLRHLQTAQPNDDHRPAQGGAERFQGR